MVVLLRLDRTLGRFLRGGRLAAVLIPTPRHCSPVPRQGNVSRRTPIRLATTCARSRRRKSRGARFTSRHHGISHPQEFFPLDPSLLPTSIAAGIAAVGPPPPGLKPGGGFDSDRATIPGSDSSGPTRR